MYGSAGAFILVRGNRGAPQSRPVLPDTVIVVDATGTIIAMNDQGLETTRDERIGANYLDLWRRASNEHPRAAAIRDRDRAERRDPAVRH